MELTVYLSKVLGLYMLIVGVAILMNRKQIMLAIAHLVEERFSQLLNGILALLFGLFLVNLHNDWTTLPAAIVSLVGWLAVAKGAVYLFMSEGSLTKLLRSLNNRKWYMIDGGVAVIVGVYLAGFGYGWF